MSDQHWEQYMTDEIRKEVINSMADNFGIQEEPQVGIFWYDKDNDELFGVSKVFVNEIPFNRNDLKTAGTLHKTWWQKQRNKLLHKKNPLGVFGKDYTAIPRGRIFQKKDGLFQMMCGNWINDHEKNHIVDLVKEEFNLQNVPFELVIDTHWDIGHGWSQEFDL